MTDRTTTTVWKLAIAAGLASCYLLTWRAITGAMTPTPDADRADDVAAPTPADGTAAPAQPVRPVAPVWIDQLPVAQRPAVQVPAGWQLAARDRRAPAPTLAPAPTTPRLVRAPTRRRVRVRTRSS